MSAVVSAQLTSYATTECKAFNAADNAPVGTTECTAFGSAVGRSVSPSVATADVPAVASPQQSPYGAANGGAFNAAQYASICAAE